MTFDKNFMSVGEFAISTGIRRNMVYRLCKDNTFPVLKIGQKFMINYQKAIEWIAEKERTTLKGGIR